MSRIFAASLFALALCTVSVSIVGAQSPTEPGSPTACSTNNALFDIPGEHSFTVPDGVSEIRVTVVGGGGGGGAGAGGWGSGGGGGCGGGVVGSVLRVTPGQIIPLTVGEGGAGGNGSQQCSYSGFPWCGSHYAAANGNSGSRSSFANVAAPGGGWGRTGFYNLFNNHAGGSGGGSGGGGGGNGWPGFYSTPGSGGTAGGQTNSQGAGGYCTGGGWQADLASLIRNAPYAAGAGGYAPGGAVYWGGGGGGGLIIGDTAAGGGDGADSPNNGGKGYGGGGGAAGLQNRGAGGAGASGAVYIEWDGGVSSASCRTSCSVSFDENPLDGDSTIIRWSAPNATLFYIKNVGYVSGSGSARVYAPGDYSGYASGVAGSAYCPAVLAGKGVQCTADSSVCGVDGNLHNACGETTSCPFGCSYATNRCHATCQASRVCSAGGEAVLNSCSGAVVENCGGRGAGWSCEAGTCVPPGPPSFQTFDTGELELSGRLTARPSLVSPGSVSTVYWNVRNAASCAVSGTNGDAWTGLFSGTQGKRTLPITGEVVYSLTCASLPGVTPTSITDSVTVRTIPAFQEI